MLAALEIGSNLTVLLIVAAVLAFLGFALWVTNRYESGDVTRRGPSD